MWLIPINITASYAGAAALRLEKVGVNLKHTDEDVKGLAQQMVLQRSELSSQFGERCEEMDGRAKFFKTLVTERVDSMGKLLAEVKGNVDGLMNGNTSAVVKLEDRIVAMENSMKEQNKKINNLLVVNGDMLEKISHIEGEQKTLKDHVENIEKHLHIFEQTTIKTFEKLTIDVQEGKDAQLFLDNNMRELKSAVNNAVNDVRRMSDLQHTLNETTQQRNVEVAANLKRSDFVLNKISDHPPTPADVAKLCSAFEQRALEAFSTAQHSTITNAMTSELALEVSLTANRLAIHVANTADMDIITSKILGPRPGPPASSAPPMYTNNHQSPAASSKYQNHANFSAARQTLGSYKLSLIHI